MGEAEEIALGFAWEQAKRPSDSPRAIGTLLEPHVRADEDLRERGSALSAEAERAKGNGDSALVSRSHHRLGLHLEASGAIEMARDSMKQAVAASDRASTDERIAAINDLGVVLARLGQHEQAESCFDEAVELGDRDAMGPASHAERNRGLMMWIGGAPDAALSVWDSAFRSGRDTDDPAANAQILNNVAILKLLEQDTDSATQLFNRAILLAQRGGDIRSLAVTYNNLGLIFSGPPRGDHFAAIPFVEMALELLAGPIDVIARLYVLNNNILVYEQAHLEPARKFRAQFAETLKFLNSSFPQRSMDAERLPYTRNSPSSNDDAGRDEWQISPEPVLLRTFSRCGVQD